MLRQLLGEEVSEDSDLESHSLEQLRAEVDDLQQRLRDRES
ncbi:MAG: hypothetical protein AAGA03_13770 [Planctomycetota bacterium]